MPNHELKHYITSASQSGMSKEQIVQTLTEAGWRVHDFIDIIVDREQKAPGENIISARNLSKNYGKVQALNDVSLDVQTGTVTALLGPNGAGKTTLVRILTTL